MSAGFAEFAVCVVSVIAFVSSLSFTDQPSVSIIDECRMCAPGLVADVLEPPGFIVDKSIPFRKPPRLIKRTARISDVSLFIKADVDDGEPMQVTDCTGPSSPNLVRPSG
ncbi:hypothetical protein [Paraprevotella xylaniphila]|uniref:hypothetical protein n=1 Tax=Paraprevotella xylaniphila TaxID=454155 RepID=UPI003FD6C3BB